MDIREALSQLDSLDDDQWTTDGAPRTEVVSELVGRKVTRAEIINAAPKFSRSNMELIEENSDAKEVEELRQGEEEVTDTSAIEAFLDQDPMLPSDFVQQVLKTMPTNQLSVLETMLIEQLAAVDVKQNELDEMRRRVKANLASTRATIKAFIPDMDNQQAIQSYIKKQNEQRLARALRMKEVLGDMKPSEFAKLDPRAVIDRAFARKTARGGQRPVR